MWELLNRTPLVAERSFVRDRNGAEVLLVVVKATFDIAEGGALTLAAKQEPIHQVPIFAGDPASSSLLYETDFYLDKPATDVVVHGTAYGRGGEPTVALEATVRVGPLVKTIAVIGDRIWKKRGDTLALGDPEPFAMMPICYERAYGGRDGDATEARNPAGTGFARDPLQLADVRAPNLERPGALIPRPGERSQPVGFGPIARSWQPRLGRAGTFDTDWQKHEMPLSPRDYDARHECCAPDDQQVAGYLTGGEAIELDMLTPSGRLETKVPALGLRVESRIGGARVRHDPRLHTLILHPDERRMIVAWHSALPCHRGIHSLRRTTVDLADG